jgi:S-formylglutathione hydrolase FrmB
MKVHWTVSTCAAVFLPLLLLAAGADAQTPRALDPDVLEACGLSHGEFTGDVQIHALEWSELNRPLCSLEILPEEALKPGETWPVVVLLHGLRGAPADWLRFAHIHRRIREIQAEGALPPTVFLLPTGHNGYWTNWADGKHPYRDLVFAYLRDAERRIPALSRDPARRAIAGISMGGFGAVSIALEHPEEFGIAVGMSPTDLVIATEQQPNRKVYRRIFGTPVDDALVRSVNPRDLVESGQGRGLVFRLFVGTAEGAKFTQGTRELADAMRANALQVDLTEIEGGKHTWDSTWNAQTHRDWLRQIGYMFRNLDDAAPIPQSANPVQRMIHGWKKVMKAHGQNAPQRTMRPR